MQDRKYSSPVEHRDLIAALVEIHFKYVDITFFPGDILKHFDSLFKSVGRVRSTIWC